MDFEAVAVATIALIVVFLLGVTTGRSTVVRDCQVLGAIHTVSATYLCKELQK